MTSVEVKRRDGLARISMLTDGETRYALPAAYDMEAIFTDLQEERLSNIPLSAPPVFVEKYAHQEETRPVSVYPSGTGVAAQSGDCVMVPNWHTAFRNPRNYVTWLAKLKDMIPPDTAWYAPAAALPSTAHILVYSGFDLFDFTAVDLKTAQGLFCLPEGEFPCEIMQSGVCGCDGCRGGDLQQHNRLALSRELALITRFIQARQLREMVDARCRMHAAHVAILRHLDLQSALMDEATPVARSTPMGAMTGDVLKRPEVKRFAERVVNRYIPPPADIVVLLPCSARKPYALSPSHRKYIAAIDGRALELIVTSPLGLVPRELERCYPAAHYDVPVTGYWDREEKAFAASVIRDYLERHPADRIIAHLEGGALDAALLAAGDLGIDMEMTCTGHPTSPASLHCLQDACAGQKRVPFNPVRGMGSWQFGAVIDTRGLEIRGRYPDLVARKGKEPYFSMDTGTGLLRPTFAGWSLIPDGYRVYIDDFTPHGDVLVPGVRDADLRIREGDEVMVEGPSATATGRAMMSAPEMRRSTRGVAVRVRTTKKT
jgi:archaeosine synthase